MALRPRPGARVAAGVGAGAMGHAPPGGLPPRGPSPRRRALRAAQRRLGGSPERRL